MGLEGYAEFAYYLFNQPYVKMAALAALLLSTTLPIFLNLFNYRMR